MQPNKIGKNMAYLPPQASIEPTDEKLIRFAINYTYGGVSSIAFIYTATDGKIYARFMTYGSKYTVTLYRGDTLRLD